MGGLDYAAMPAIRAEWSGRGGWAALTMAE
jgi:hypothetical protein